MHRHRSWNILLVVGLIGILVGACTTSAGDVEVSVAVDFGPAARPPIERTLKVAERSTVFEALRAAFQVSTSGR
jgi:hypothetical protein